MYKCIYIYAYANIYIYIYYIYIFIYVYIYTFCSCLLQHCKAYYFVSKCIFSHDLLDLVFDLL